MKCEDSLRSHGLLASIPARVSWIEIKKLLANDYCRGGRYLRGYRGLKLFMENVEEIQDWSIPARVSWIEIHFLYQHKIYKTVDTCEGIVD